MYVATASGVIYKAKQQGGKYLIKTIYSNKTINHTHLHVTVPSKDLISV